MRQPAHSGIASVLALLVVSGCATASPSASPSSALSPSARPTPSRTPEPGTLGDLPTIVLDEDDLEPGETIDSLDVGLGALLQPVALLENSTLVEQPGFLDARMTRIGTQGQDSYWDVGGYVSWAAVYTSEADAETAFGVLIAEHESDTGWAMGRVGRPPYGDEGVSLDGAAYGWDANRLHVWRQANVVLAAGALGMTATSDASLERWEAITRRMDAAANAELRAADIALAADEAPPGTAFNGSGDGQEARTSVIVSGRSEEILALPGFVEGQYRTFSGDGGAVLVLALVFDTTEHADGAFAAYLEELSSDEGYGLGSGTPTAWGDEGTCATGPVPTPLGEETICLWRTGSAVMAVGGALEDERLFTIAQDMDERAG